MKTDAQIQKDVMDQLKWDPFLSSATIGVAVKDGVVTLSGEVDSFARKVAAERQTLQVAGVRAIAEDMQIGVLPASRKSDADIAGAVVHALQWNSSVPDDKIKVRVEDGDVYLEGEVDWEYQRAAARNAVEQIVGVRWVHNGITLKPRATTGDVRQKINEAFQRSANIDANKITVIVDGNTATLHGTVRSFAEKEDAGKAAWTAPGITRVSNQLKISMESQGIFEF
ncbi:BON domain-containing protein [Flaviaesturariibacter flavus]|uniref:BON domain-containing protein n=1 Tax=Flaviaesturariibacter flavus TaxID=2502780 RepID=A0A4R1BNN3_9BACT|nr:BON domain-containing protein [Flaviaesturariibacter flavus]TCJ19081.1 BON domain-containing protein [Flaviaesturariibacter flavus]